VQLPLLEGGLAISRQTLVLCALGNESCQRGMVHLGEGGLRKKDAAEILDRGGASKNT
jgi:hypothetical protein